MAAKNYWSLAHGSNFFIPKAPEIFEKLIDFYITMGFVPRKRHEKVLEENGNLKEENTLLRNTISDLQCNVLTHREGNGQGKREKLVGKQPGLEREREETPLERLV
ncbi:MAG TPA: hypothetical protein VEI96_08195 [Thermodesulfovibrionales bacterium]|nr:hypothetical protein [Thermodesulfovibrionales bacterium]